MKEADFRTSPHGMGDKTPMEKASGYDPRPRWFFRVYATLFLLVSLLILGMTVGNLFVYGDACGLGCAAVMTLMFLPVAFWQDRAWFGGKVEAAKPLGWLLMLLAGAVGGILVMSASQAMRERASWSESAWWVWWLGGGVVLLTVGSGVYFHRASQLALKPQVVLLSPPRWRWLVYGGLLAASATGYGLTKPPVCAVGVDRDQSPWALPSDATEVSFVRGPRGIREANFTTTELAFRVWIEEEFSLLIPVKYRGGVKVVEGTVVIDECGCVDGRPQYGGSKGNDASGQEPGPGLIYTWFKPNDDHSVNAQFNRRTGRARLYAAWH